VLIEVSARARTARVLLLGVVLVLAAGFGGAADSRPVHEVTAGGPLPGALALADRLVKPALALGVSAAPRNGLPAAPEINVAAMNPGETVERDLCLTIAVGPDAASECGDLRIVHALPAVRTLSRERAPVLLYNSDHAHPYAIVRADVRLPDGSTGLSRVEATLTVNGQPRARSVYKGANWPGSSVARIAVGFGASSDPTAVYRYRLEVKAYYGADSGISAATGDLVVVNRKDSYFGAGWWIAGLDQLVLDHAGNSALWLGGDGSVRRYRSAGTDRWVAPNVDRPDTLKRDGSGFVRFLSGGVQVRFDSLGRHIATRSRLGHETTFTYEARGRLERITVPFAPADYVFRYGVNGVLEAVDAPYVSNSVRTTRVTMAGGRITAIDDPDSTRVAFGYLNPFGSRITQRTDRRGVATSFTYDAGGRLLSSALRASSSQEIVTRLRAAETFGLLTASDTIVPDTSVAYTRLDGPRTDVPDTTFFWVDRLGTPRRVRDAAGGITTLLRGNATYPALVTQVTDAAGLVTNATYDARGNVATVTVVNPYGAILPENAVTQYEWDPKWDAVTRIDLPEGEVTTFAYDPSNGNRLWQQVGPSQSRRVTFGYDPVFKLLAGVTYPAIPSTDSIYYDGRGNVSETVTPLGFRSFVLNDAIGRVVKTRTPVDTLQTVFQTDTLIYDLMDRVRVTESFGPTPNPQTLLADNSYDSEGNLLSVARMSDPDINSIGWITNEYSYDGAGRKITETNPQGPTDTIRYDPAGNVVAHTRTGTAMQYDVLGRMTRRTSWDDTARFTYDVRGNLVSATNLHARVARSYFPIGALATDTLMIQTIEPTPVDENWSGYTAHVYGLRHTYDLNGRRVVLKHPGTIAPEGTGVRDSVRYGYDSETGALAWVEGLGESSRSDFIYNIDGQLDTLRYPAGVTVAMSYDADGRVTRRKHCGLAGGSFPGGCFLDHSYTYDPRAKILTVASGGMDPVFVTNNYSALGHVFYSDDPNSPNRGEGWLNDALGNHRERDYSDSVYNVYDYTYEPLSGRLRSMILRDTTATADTLNYFHDIRGNRTNVRQAKKRIPEQPPLPERQYIVETLTYYNVEQKHDEMRRLSSQLLGAGLNKHEQYRYDALGRRVWKRAVNGWRDTVRDTLCLRDMPSTECMSFVERTVWDGDQILYEIRTNLEPGDPLSQGENDTPNSLHFNRTVYTHAGGIDNPVEILWLGDFQMVPLAPHTDWRGSFIAATYTGAQYNDCGLTGPPHWGGTECHPLDWYTFSAYYQPKITYYREDAGPRSWFGNLVREMRDGSGLLFKRHRYYDPTAGRFTQEDPIGVVGGVNLHGFADGDPINFTDPFGLQGCSREHPEECTLADVARNVLQGLASVWSGDFTDKGPGWQMGVALAEVGLMFGARAPIGPGAASMGGRSGAAISEILMPGGRSIGFAGSTSSIREVVGGVAEGQVLFNRLARGGTRIRRNDYPGTFVRLPGGGTIGFRTVMSRSERSAATIDINVPGVPIRKIKFNPWDA